MSQNVADIPNSALKVGEKLLEKPKTHQITVKLGTEDYGQLIRYCNKTKLTMAEVLRKGFHLYLNQVIQTNKEKKQEKDGIRLWGRPIKIMKNEDYLDVVEIDKDILKQVLNDLSYDSFKIWLFLEMKDIGSNIYFSSLEIGDNVNYEKGFSELVEKGYLVEQEDGSFTFYDDK